MGSRNMQSETLFVDQHPRQDERVGSTKRLLLSALSVSALVLVAMCGISWNNKSDEDSSSSMARLFNQRHRKMLTYSELSQIPPDPDSLPVGDDVKNELAAKYGRWKFWDGDEDNRPDDSKLCDEYKPNCDIPGEDFPDEGWQGDAVFVNHILNDADNLVTRAMEAIFEEYGHPKPKSAEGLSERMKMFHWEKVDLSTATEPPEAFKKSGNRGIGGWTTKRSFDGLVRRLLHAMMTNGDFVVVVAGHSSAAGHGNHFRQSYIMQMHKVMAPIFARLGVKLITRNISLGGLGTVQGTMGAADIYGRDIDILIWDSGMTERASQDHIDLFFRQGLIGGDKVPVIWSAGGNFNALKMLHQEADADVGEFGLGLDGVILTESEEQAKTLPWAVRYLQCHPDHASVCKQHDSYCAKCWVPREDVKPEVEQRDTFGSQVSWHPGWRQHQLTGRVIAFSILEALQQAVQQFSDGTMGGPPLADEYWHVADYYENIRNKVKNLDPSLGECHKIKDKLPERMCSTPMNGRTQYTPRAYYEESSLTSIVKPAKDGYVPKNDKKALYEGPDAHNDCYDIPPGEVDVLAIVSGRRRMLEELPFNFSATAAGATTAKAISSTTQTESSINQHQGQQQYAIEAQQHRELDEIVPGRGWELVDEPQGHCDGTYYAVCSRWTRDTCILGGHHDARGSLVGNALSGWLVMTLKGVKEGIIVLKVHSWAKNEANTITADWTTENNARQRMLELDGEGESEYFDSDVELPDHRNQRLLGKDAANDFPDNFRFEYAINGKITSLSKAKYIEKRQQLQRVVETLTLLDDPNFTQEETDVEVAVRLQGCGRDCTIGVSHIYWA